MASQTVLSSVSCVALKQLDVYLEKEQTKRREIWSEVEKARLELERTKIEAATNVAEFRCRQTEAEAVIMTEQTRQRELELTLPDPAMSLWWSRCTEPAATNISSRDLWSSYNAYNKDPLDLKEFKKKLRKIGVRIEKSVLTTVGVSTGVKCRRLKSIWFEQGNICGAR